MHYATRTIRIGSSDESLGKVGYSLNTSILKKPYNYLRGCLKSPLVGIQKF
ncbi:hypothetical protein NIES4072_62500 [Nostoc commune NIES-4072]|uniref:Uncharacterized protein n=1 Tax=Nostoc commune NIES-4072 TaxID=2005467 RepID=A0A2R5FWU7_NOSCO|nr:hypothetical protein NIES4070_28460 [Nostoc commune HK-02]GBG22539.1 hypothetical protein NIES4072_62500 [Nostoc commune NIES-4072]